MNDIISHNIANLAGNEIILTLKYVNGFKICMIRVLLKYV